MTTTTPAANPRELLLRPWPTPLDHIRYLSNQEVRQTGDSLQLSLQNLETQEVHTFTFSGTLGFKFTVAHGMRRLGSTFTVENSPWIKEHAESPFRTKRLDGAVHYLFSSSDGEFEILAMGPPLYNIGAPPVPTRRKRSSRREPQNDG